MRKLALLIACLTSLPCVRMVAAEQPRGHLLELHSCEVYAGGCVVSSEALQGGRYMLRAWEFTGGQFGGSDLAGLQVAVLQTSSDNLAEPKTAAGQAVVYLPQSGTAAQREALLAWMKSSCGELKEAKLQTRVAPLHFSTTSDGYSFSAGKGISVSTTRLEMCDNGSCGESLWYSPRSGTSIFTVAVCHSSAVAEPLLKLKWNETGKRDIFLGNFGDSDAKGQYVTSADLCGAGQKMF